MSDQTFHVLGIAGSLRSGSFNRSLLEAARELAPENVVIEVHDLKEIPLYDADLDTDERRPVAVVHFKEAIARADGLLIATPEYNHNIPGVLQNAIDWASRPARRSVLRGKPAGIMGAATSGIGTARAQQILKLVLEATLSPVMPHAGVVIGNATEKFDGEGNLVHEPTRRFLAAYLEELYRWIERFTTN